MCALRTALLVAAVALLGALALAASATAGRQAFVPNAIQTTSYVWPQPPAWVGVVPVAAWQPRSTAYVWAQPPSWIPISG
jgi:hypothetical protein